jgi:hypothetical protein
MKPGGRRVRAAGQTQQVRFNHFIEPSARAWPAASSKKRKLKAQGRRRGTVDRLGAFPLKMKRGPEADAKAKNRRRA